MRDLTANYILIVVQTDQSPSSEPCRHDRVLRQRVDLLSSDTTLYNVESTCYLNESTVYHKRKVPSHVQGQNLDVRPNFEFS